MKRILYVVGIGLVVILGIVISRVGSITEYTQPIEVPSIHAPEPTPEELMEQATQKLIASAIAASSTSIEQAKEEAAKKVEDEIKLKIEKQVRDQMAATNEERQAEIEKKLSF